MGVKITTLVENTTPVGIVLLGEHGLAFYIETEDKKILFDTGQGNTIENNARFLGVKLGQIDTLVLSHGHYDHTSGLPAVLKANPNIRIVAHPDIFTQKMNRRSEQIVLPIGMPMDRKAIENKGADLQLTKESVEIAPGVITTGEVPKVTDFEGYEPDLLVKDGDELKVDPMEDDLAIVIDSDKGSVVVLGCAHHGVVNTLKRVRELNGGGKIHAVMGGLHLYGASDDQIKKTIDGLREFDLDKIGASHCTGAKATAALINEFGDKFFSCNVGTTLEV